MTIKKAVESYNLFVEEAEPESFDWFQLEFDSPASPEQLNELQAYSPVSIPEALKSFYLQNGGIRDPLQNLIPRSLM
jgi:hypothetical protein